MSAVFMSEVGHSNYFCLIPVKQTYGRTCPCWTTDGLCSQRTLLSNLVIN